MAEKYEVSASGWLSGSCNYPYGCGVSKFINNQRVSFRQYLDFLVGRGDRMNF